MDPRETTMDDEIGEYDAWECGACGMIHTSKSQAEACCIVTAAELEAAGQERLL